jgi:hypothetical protein
VFIAVFISEVRFRPAFACTCRSTSHPMKLSHPSFTQFAGFVQLKDARWIQSPSAA